MLQELESKWSGASLCLLSSWTPRSLVSTSLCINDPFPVSGSCLQCLVICFYMACDGFSQVADSVPDLRLFTVCFGLWYQPQILGKRIGLTFGQMFTKNHKHGQRSRSWSQELFLQGCGQGKFLRKGCRLLRYNIISDGERFETNSSSNNRDLRIG